MTLEPGTLFRVKGYRCEFESVTLGNISGDTRGDELELPLGEVGVVVSLHEGESNKLVDAYVVLVGGKQGWLFQDEIEVQAGGWHLDVIDPAGDS